MLKTGTLRLGGRNRNVLVDFIEDAKLKLLQSDGYNVYTYLDDELKDIEHLCCLAHARAKFKYAYEQGCKSAYFFLYNDRQTLQTGRRVQTPEAVSSGDIRTKER